MDNYGGGPSRSGVVYHGYPYVNPTVQDVPTISAEDAAKWSNLPRRPADSAVKSGDQAEGSGSQEPGRTGPKLDPDENPTVYIDLPQSSGSAVSDRRRENQQEPGRTGPKLDPDENPTVYIDLPQSSGSEVADRRQVEDDQTYVQDTIFYDPFKDQRIGPGSVSSGSSGDSSRDRPRLHPRPNPPNSLNVASQDRGFPGSSSMLPPSMSKQTDVYGQFGLPTEYRRGDFPEPPPAYTETDSSPMSGGTLTGTPATPATPATPPVEEEPPRQTVDIPRTQVIIPADSLQVGGHTALCHGCGSMSNLLLITETGLVTHLIACCLLMFALFPLIVLVYCTSWCKYKNYYCRFCNKLVAYEIPIACQGLTYVK